MNAGIESVRGMHDILHNEHQLLLQVQERLLQSMVGYGYHSIDLPIIEHRDLYLRKIGEELVGKTYEFSFGGRHLALRPEWTASILRAYVAHMQDQPLPLRLRYSGPVFRYQRPQRLTYRQFTQTGVELIGAPPPRSDAEVLALACHGLDAVGVDNYTLRIGHIGVIREILVQLGLAERTQGLLLWSLERMRTHGLDAIRENLLEQAGPTSIDPSLLEGLDDEQVTTLLLHMFQAMDVNLSFGTRPPEAIVGRLVRKLRRDDPQPRIEQALNLLWHLSQICDEPSASLQQATTLLEAEGINAPSLNELHAIFKTLEAHGGPTIKVLLDFGMGRGLHYYTGMIFEIFDATDMQICGGGRYDDLVLALGGRQSVPAVGFSYGLERVVAAANMDSLPVTEPREVLIVPVNEDDYTYALHVAHQLRACDYIATIDVRGRTVSVNLRDAARRQIPYVVIVGADERERNEVVWRNLATREEQRVRVDELSSML